MKKAITSIKQVKESITSLKNETHKKASVKKGYNEINPTQPQGAFIPDAMNKKK